MKKTILFLLCVFISVCMFAFGGEEGKPIDGRWWNSLEYLAKLSCVIGITHGVHIVADLLSDNLPFQSSPKETTLVFQRTKELLTPHLAYGEMIEKIDKFYEDPSKVNVGLQTAYMYICMDTPDMEEI